MSRPDVLLVQLPSPPRKNVFREWAGGMGTSQPSAREHAGHDRGYYEIPYSQLLWIARALEQRGIGCRYVDLQAQERFDAAAFERDLLAEPPRVALAVVNLPSYGHDRALLRRMKALLPELRVVLLGPASKLEPEALLREGAGDFVMSGEEELAAPELVERVLADGLAAEVGSCWRLRGGAAVQEPARERMRDLDAVDFPAYHLLDFERYRSGFFWGREVRYATVYTSKGCAYDCVYCPYPFGFGTKFLYRSPELVVEDVARLEREFGVEQVCFRDQVFTVKRKHTVAICEGLIARGTKAEWVCETRYDLVDPELLALMRRAGCREVHYGLETADEDLFRDVGKPGGPVSLARFEEAIAQTKEAGMRAHLHLILGLPGESWTTVRNTIRFLRRTRPHTVQTAILSPYPGTPLYDRLKADGTLAQDDWERFGGFEAVQPTEHMSVAELERARRYVDWNWDKTAWDKVKLRARRLFTRAGAVLG